MIHQQNVSVPYTHNHINQDRLHFYKQLKHCSHPNQPVHYPEYRLGLLLSSVVLPHSVNKRNCNYQNFIALFVEKFQ